MAQTYQLGEFQCSWQSVSGSNASSKSYPGRGQPALDPAQAAQQLCARFNGSEGLLASTLRSEVAMWACSRLDSW